MRKLRPKKRRGGALARRPRNAPEMGDYFSEFEIVTKFVDSWVPRPFTAVMIAIAIPAVIRPYSMAVAPDSSLKNDLMIGVMAGSDLGFGVRGTEAAPAVQIREQTEMNLRLS